MSEPKFKIKDLIGKSREEAEIYLATQGIMTAKFIKKSDAFSADTTPGRINVYVDDDDFVKKVVIC